ADGFNFLLPVFARREGDALHGSPADGLFACARVAATRAAVAAAFGEGAAEASASGVASAGSRGEGAAFGVGADAVTSPPSVVIAVWKDDGDKAAVAIWALLGLVWLVFAE